MGAESALVTREWSQGVLARLRCRYVGQQDSVVAAGVSTKNSGWILPRSAACTARMNRSMSLRVTFDHTESASALSKGEATDLGVPASLKHALTTACTPRRRTHTRACGQPQEIPESGRESRVVALSALREPGKTPEGASQLDRRNPPLYACIRPEMVSVSIGTTAPRMNREDA